MERTALQSTIENVETGSKLRLTFNNGTGPKLDLDSDTMSAFRFFMLGAENNLSMQGNDYFSCRAVLESGYFDQESNRVVEVEATEHFDPDWFVGRLHRGLEGVEVLS